MAINYYLQPNPITPDPNDQSARVAPVKVLNVEDIVKLMLQRGTTLTETDIRAVINLAFFVISSEVSDGNAVNTPLVNIRPSITGVFTSATDTYDPSRHITRASISAGNMLYERMQNAKVEKMSSSQRMPSLIEYMDVNTGTTNSIITPGGIGQLVGEELKFNPALPAQVFL